MNLVRFQHAEKVISRASEKRKVEIVHLHGSFSKMPISFLNRLLVYTYMSIG